MQFIETLIKIVNFGISDIFDILIVSIIFYYFLRFIKGSSAFQVFISIIIIIFLSFISRVVGLRGLSLIMKELQTMWLIAFIILFHPEIRTLLAKFSGVRGLNIKGLSTWLKESELKKVIKEIVKAIGEMQQKKMGALIVIEQGVELGEYVKRGVILNADVTSPLIVSIFTVPSPLHDGACIIKNNKIIAAGSILPINEDLEIERYYGLRHRAGLSISLITDAIAIILSEENQSISYAYNSTFYRGLSLEELREDLEKILIRRKDEH